MEDSIYKTPSSNRVHEKVTQQGKVLAIISCILQIPIYWGLLGFITGMITTFQAITLFGTGDPEVMKSGLTSALVLLLQGCIFALPGYFLALFVLIKIGYRSSLFSFFNAITSLGWLASVPWGTLFGIVYIIVQIIYRRKGPNKNNQRNAANNASS